MNSGQPVDVLIVGGGINGTGVARDAAGRGLSVLLCEKGDLAEGTSSASSKMIHGGLRYLEQFEFRLVREALAEREVLLGIAPHIISPLRFVLPHDVTLRPAWMIRIGLFLYDHLSGRRRLLGSRGMNLRRHAAGKALQERLRWGFEYSDCWVDDARLVVLNAMDARERGATIRTRTEVIAARREGALWRVTLRGAEGSGETGSGETEVSARTVVNAAGPWIGRVMGAVFGDEGYSHLSLVKGSHLVVPRIYEEHHAYIFQHTDRRVVFVLPFGEAFSLIGTTDVPVQGDPGEVAMSDEEAEYLCGAVNRYLRVAVRPSDAVWSFAGVRPLYDDASDDPSAVSREYVLELDAPQGAAPLLSLIGGKITAYRQVSQHALEKLAPFFPGLSGPWTGQAPLPGGDLPDADFDAWREAFGQRYAWLPQNLAQRVARAYGTRAVAWLGDARTLADLGRDFGAGLYEREVDYLMRHEWARCAADVLYRRSKLGLALGAAQQAALEDWMRAALPGIDAA